jgi:hypothetical protein
MIQVKKKICDSCETEQIIWKNHDGNKYCRKCWLDKTFTLPKKYLKPIKPKSDKKSIQDQLYTVLRNKFFQDDNNKSCKARLQGCALVACDVHHTKGRGEYQNDVSTWIPLCRSCHNYIETHPAEAKELNFSLNRLKNG